MKISNAVGRKNESVLLSSYQISYTHQLTCLHKTFQKFVFKHHPQIFLYIMIVTCGVCKPEDQNVENLKLTSHFIESERKRHVKIIQLNTEKITGRWQKTYNGKFRHLQSKFRFFSGSTPIGDLGVIIFEVPHSYSDTRHSVGVLWTNDQQDAETSA